ncbi:hypothetical protein GJ744_011915 [Endocarpon pusillum]|uniref:Peptidase M13 N-terminal domain-containing protein n=1 Tax=Endocarpon pusillum TaxID=364733 RepID=A0A8H7ATR9_9EURO|nr:hypothetical protein GJ744_011915 [Endocarpon pusillum]
MAKMLKVNEHFPQPPPSELRGFLSATNHHTRKSYDTPRKVLVRNAKYILVACLLALLTLLTSILIGSFFHHKDDKKIYSCQSPECVHAASEILYNLDPDYAELDACTQFDRMVCGGWELRHDLRPDQGDMFTGTIMAERSKTILRHILEESSSKSPSSPADQDNFKKLKDDYDSCMNEKELQDIGLKPLQGTINQIKMSFPMAFDDVGHNTSKSPETTSQWKGIADGANQFTEALLNLIELDIGAFLAFNVEADDRDPDSQVLMVTPPRQIGLPSKEYYNNTEVVKEYQSMTATVLKQFFEDLGNATLFRDRRNSEALDKSPYQMAPQMEIKNLPQEIVDLEVKLAAATPPTEEQEDVTKYYNPMTVTEIHDLLPQVSFDYIIAQLAPKGYSPEKIIVGSPAYMAALAELLSSSTNETLQAFFVWKAVQRYEEKVEHPSLEPLRAFNNKLRGVDPSAKEERWRTCIDAVDGDLGWILSKFFVEAAFSENSKNFGDQIVTDIKDSFTTTLDNTEWMTNEVRDRAIKKVHAIDQKIGYPTSNPNVLDPEALRKYYSAVTISNTTFFENKVQVAHFETQQAWNKLGKPTRRDEWDMTVPTVNAYYNLAGNEIVFPAGIMQAPVFYDPSVPQ